MSGVLFLDSMAVAAGATALALGTGLLAALALAGASGGFRTLLMAGTIVNLALPPFQESLLIPNTVALVAKPGGPSPAARQLFEYLQSPAVLSALIAAGALDSNAPAASAVQPDWTRLVSELDGATEQLAEVFRR